MVITNNPFLFTKLCDIMHLILTDNWKQVVDESKEVNNEKDSIYTK